MALLQIPKVSPKATFVNNSYLFSQIGCVFFATDFMFNFPVYFITK